MYLLSEEQIEEIFKWQYVAVDESFTTKIMTPIWNNMLMHLSTKIPANALTLTGCFCPLITYMMYMYLDGDLIEWLPWFVLAIILFQTFDALDGKQARRTFTSSPIGELLDHTCDQVSSVITVLISCECLEIYNIGDQWNIAILSQLIFYYFHLSSLKTRTVYFSYIGPVDAFYAAILIFIVKWFYPDLDGSYICYILPSLIVVILYMIYMHSDSIRQCLGFFIILLSVPYAEEGATCDIWSTCIVLSIPVTCVILSKMIGCDQFPGTGFFIFVTLLSCCRTYMMWTSAYVYAYAYAYVDVYVAILYHIIIFKDLICKAPYPVYFVLRDVL